MILALTTSRKILKTVTSRCGVMAQWLGILAALLKDPHGCSRPSVTAAPEEVMPPSDLCWHQTHTWDTDILAGKILVHIKKERAVKKKKKKRPPGTTPVWRETEMVGGLAWTRKRQTQKESRCFRVEGSPGVIYPSCEWLLCSCQSPHLTDDP